MIIGFDASRAFIENRTGTENYSYQLLLNLAKIDRENEYVVYLRPGDQSSVLSSLFSESSQSVIGQSETGKQKTEKLSASRRADNRKLKTDNRILPPSNFHLKIIPFPRFWTQLGLAIQTFKDDLDILFVPSHTLPLIRKPGLKTVITVHDLGAEYLPSLHQLKQRLYLKAMTHFQLKTATRIIAVSKATKDDIVKKVGISKNKIDVVYEGCDTKKFKVQSSKFKVEKTLKNYNLHPKSYLLFVGTIQPRKNLERLIQAYGKAIKAINETKGIKGENKESLTTLNPLNPINLPSLVLAGAPGWMSDEIYSLPKKLGIEEEVKFLGRVPDEDLPALYQNALGFVYPSLFEGFGLPILESYQSRIPVLTSNLSSMPEIAGPSAILVDPYDIDSISNGLKELITLDEKSRNKKIRQGEEWVKRFSWEKCARETLEVLNKAIKEV